jgi:hypothetical protein
MLRPVLCLTVVLLVSGFGTGYSTAQKLPSTNFHFLNGHKPMKNLAPSPFAMDKKPQPTPVLYTFRFLKAVEKELKSKGYEKLWLYGGGHNYLLPLPKLQKEISVDIHPNHRKNREDRYMSLRKGWVTVRVWVRYVRSGLSN